MLLRLMFGSLCLTSFLGIAADAAERRIALVIGNSAYVRAPKLDNPRKDAAAMAAMLKAAGFSEVVTATDVGATQMRRTFRDFADLAHSADVAVLFYAGHGIEVAGVNYMIPVDAVLERDIDVQDEAIPLDRITQILEPVRRLRLIILDACRDNPFARSMRRTIQTRSIRSGYGEIDERSLPPNTLIAYAQRAGATAEDGTDGNSPYTKALLKYLPVPGIDIELSLRRVRDEVLRTTRNRQEPFKYGSLGGSELPLVPKDAVGESAKPDPPPPLETEARREWMGVDKTSAAELQAFLTRHGASPEATYARARLEEIGELKRREQASSDQAERARRAEAQRLAALEARERELAATEARQKREREAAVRVPQPDPPKFLPSPPVGTAFRVKAGVSQGVHNMRSGPGTGHSLVVSIPAGASAVMVDLGNCREPDDGRSANQWCRATWQGRSGWVSMGGLTR